MRDAGYQRVRAPGVYASDLYFQVYSGNTGGVTVPLDLRTQLEQVVLEGFTAVDHGRAVDSLSQLTADRRCTTHSATASR
jgi:hypothetical protein